MQFTRDGKSRTITVTDIPLRVAGITTAGDTMTVNVSYEGDSSGRVGHALDNAVLPLMAAAPALLEALRLCADKLRAWTAEDEAALEAAEAAIAAAEGRD